jgi:hypothetical protein
MAINSVSTTTAADSINEQKKHSSATKPKTDFSKTLATATASAPPAQAPKQVTTSTPSNLQSGDGTKATA